MKIKLHKLTICFILAVGFLFLSSSDAAVSENEWEKIAAINKKGPYLGIVVPNNFEMSPLLQSPSFVPLKALPYFDFAGKRFRFGKVENESVIVVLTGLSMLNAGITTQLLVTLFNIKGILHFGIAGNANSELQIGDVTIPRYWAHTGLWNWQRFGDGTDDELALECHGDYTREIGFLNFSDFNIDDNLLNRVWFQPEEVFPIDGNPEIRQHAFWIPVNNRYFSLAKNLEGLELGACVYNTTCLPRRPKVIRVERGISSNTFVDNAAYRKFLNSKFNATAIDMESAAVGLVCLQQRIPFVTIRAISDLAGGGDSSMSNEANSFAPLAANNAVDVLTAFISLLKHEYDGDASFGSNQLKRFSPQQHCTFAFPQNPSGCMDLDLI
ncbi:OLC1v1037366C1 [Oldenlandia corymbosa var. corymbosa]|uniref:OLC1v1037366C1 n=1 Tax=Oldenlandia corymbosa var. corymbosa TaxID=529605 RepID=A0AAV1CYV9_OLDCO|nr:OLC1v1037366C1 [Oldenlandia corymbosa var. corymbosa]